MTLRIPQLPSPHFSRTGKLGIALTAVFLVFAVLSPELGPSPDSQRLAEILDAPSRDHLMGTDQLGRDQLSRIAVGARNSLLTVVTVVAVSGVGGGLIGLLSGFMGGKTDLLVQRGVDALMSMPLVVLVLAVVAAAGTSFLAVTLAIGVAFMPVTIRVARSSVVSLRSSGYVAAAHVSGASTGRIILRHLVPNAAGPWAIVAGSQAAAAVLVEAALAFLGVAPGRITLGGLLGGEAQTFMYGAPWLILWPGVTLALLALTANLLGEWVADNASTRPGA